MPDKNDELDLSVLLLLIGGIWILTKLFKTPCRAGIGALPNAERKLTSYVSKKGVQEFKNDLLQFDRNEQGVLIRMIIEARLRNVLSMPFFKTLKGTKLSAELRSGQWRILIYVISNKEYLMLSAFKKKTDETPKTEIEKAERRLNEYLSR